MIFWDKTNWRWVLGLVLMATSSVDAKIVEPMVNVEWQFNTGRHCWPDESRREKVNCSVYSGESVALLNWNNNKVVGKGERKFGINLVWGATDSKLSFDAFNFNGPIQYQLRMALKINGEYVNYGERDYGINLKYSKRPSYEWEIRGGERGTSVNAALPMGIYNAVADDYLVNCSRDYGIDLKWARDCDRKDTWAHVNTSYPVKVFFATKAKECEKRGSYDLKVEPVKLLGSVGQKGKINMTHHWENARGPGVCIVPSPQLPNLAAGVWKFTITEFGKTSECWLQVPTQSVFFYRGDRHCKIF